MLIQLAFCIHAENRGGGVSLERRANSLSNTLRPAAGPQSATETARRDRRRWRLTAISHGTAHGGRHRGSPGSKHQRFPPQHRSAATRVGNSALGGRSGKDTSQYERPAFSRGVTPSSEGHLGAVLLSGPSVELETTTSPQSPRAALSCKGRTRNEGQRKLKRDDGIG